MWVVPRPAYQLFLYIFLMYTCYMSPCLWLTYLHFAKASVVYWIFTKWMFVTPRTGAHDLPLSQTHIWPGIGGSEGRKPQQVKCRMVWCSYMPLFCLMSTTEMMCWLPRIDIPVVLSSYHAKLNQALAHVLFESVADHLQNTLWRQLSTQSCVGGASK